jgi:hypothetical protein
LLILIAPCCLSLRTGRVTPAGPLRGLELRRVRVNAGARTGETGAVGASDRAGEVSNPPNTHARGELPQAGAQRADLSRGVRKLPGCQLAASCQRRPPARAVLLRQDPRSDLVGVKSARSAVLAFRPARFSGPLPAPGVPLSRHRALRKPREVRMVLILCLARERGCASPGSGSA